MPTAAEIETELTIYFPDVASARRRAVIQRIHDTLRSKLNLDKSLVTITTLTADTREFALTDTYSRVLDVSWVASSTDGFGTPLAPISIEELDATVPDWRDKESEQPTHWYIFGNKIGLYPIITVASSGGYPRLNITTHTFETLSFSGSPTTLPAFLPDHSAWVYGSAYHLAVEKKDDRIAFFKEFWDQKFEELNAFIHQRTARLNPNISPDPVMSRISRI